MRKEFIKFVFSYPRLYSLYLSARHFKTSTFFSFKNYPIRDVVVCGMARSGSTLLFNIIKEMLKCNASKVDPYFINNSQYHELLKNEISLTVKKNHRYTPLLKRRIKSGLSIGFFTHRDIRDVVVSLMQKGRITNFDKWVERGRLRKIANDALLYANLHRVKMIEYQDLLNNKGNVIDIIKSELNLNLLESEKEDIITKTDIHQTKKKLQSMEPGSSIDLTTHLHQNHISDGLIGKWREILSNHQIEVINHEVKDFLIRFNYL